MVERGKERVRIETRVVFPPREETVTARVQARYLPAARSIEVISRAVSQIKLNLPKEWLPVAVNWNGAEVAHANTAGCLLLEEKKELLSSNRCP